MSVQSGFWDTGPDRSEFGTAVMDKRASLAREMRYLLTISTDSGRRGNVSPAGVAHSLGVCLIEDSNMARGGKNGKASPGGAAMPRFVDIKLTAEQRDEFKEWPGRGGDIVRQLQALADDGYRFGVSWSGEHQTYTVSMTGRSDGNPNSGLCMTSFAGSLETALWLAVYKHFLVAEEDWTQGASGAGEDFG